MGRQKPFLRLPPLDRLARPLTSAGLRVVQDDHSSRLGEGRQNPLDAGPKTTLSIVSSAATHGPVRSRGMLTIGVALSPGCEAPSKMGTLTARRVSIQERKRGMGAAFVHEHQARGSKLWATLVSI